MSSAMRLVFTLTGKVMQDSNTDRMTHTVFDLVEYASHMMTLHPGDLILTGTPAAFRELIERKLPMKDVPAVQPVFRLQLAR